MVNLPIIRQALIVTPVWFRLVRLRLWKTYYLAPAAFAPAYTRWSRNFLNLGIVALMVSWFFATGVVNVRFAFADMTNDNVRLLPRIKGEWLYITRLRSVSACIVTPGTDQPIACIGGGPSMLSHPPKARSLAVGYLYSERMIVQLEIDGKTVLSVPETQAYFRRQAFVFFWLVFFAALMFGLSVARQARLVAFQGGSK